jgi:MFS family permease
LLVKRFFIVLCIFILLGRTSQVMACSSCTLAHFDYFFPPFVLWQFFPIVWFIAACIATSRDGTQTVDFPRPWKGVLIGIGTLIVGMAFAIGPVLALLLFIPPVILSFKTANRRIRRKWGKRQSKKYIAVSAIGSIALLCFIVITILIRSNRTPGEYVVQWGSIGQGRSIIRELKNDPTADLDEIRLIVSKSDTRASAELVQTLANRGNPTTDFPILLNALKKSRARSISTEADIEAALRILTGLKLPEKTSIQQWQKAYNHKSKMKITMTPVSVNLNMSFKNALRCKDE